MIDGPRKLEAWRSRQGLDQEQAAERLGVSRTTISKWENGRAEPSGRQLVILELVTSIPPRDWFDLKDLVEPVSPAPPAAALLWLPILAGLVWLALAIADTYPHDAPPFWAERQIEREVLRR